MPDANALRDMLLATRARTLSLSSDLTAEQLLGPKLAIVNPPLWEIGHLAWFQEHWCLRHGHGHGPGEGALAASRIHNADALYNSAIIAHDARWDAPLLSLSDTLAYLEGVLEDVLMRIDNEGATPHLAYFVQLAAFHEVMHCEAFTYTRQTLAYAPPPVTNVAAASQRARIDTGDALISGGVFMLGAARGEGFVFDNEKWAHEVCVKPFRMARTAVTNAQFAAFVDAGGYAHRSLWSEAGWRWREQSGANAPNYWIRRDGIWLARRYDEVELLTPDAAVIHVNWFEAEAYCNWARRRLPTEVEWEFAASTAPGDALTKRRYPWGNAAPSAAHANLYGVCGKPCDVGAHAAGDSAWGVRQMFGNVWEWTADWFSAYPGFVRDPYKEYSEPWFGNHKVLRGGCHATDAYLLRNTWRNFYTPDRRDVLAGFRTCALTA